MRVFVTGASGWIGSAVVPELHRRRPRGRRPRPLGRSPPPRSRPPAPRSQRGDLDDLDSLRSGAAAADGVIHLAFKHDSPSPATSTSAAAPIAVRSTRSATSWRAPTGRSSSPPARSASRPGAWPPSATADAGAAPLSGTEVAHRAADARARRPRRPRHRSCGCRRPSTATATTASWRSIVGIAREKGVVGLRRRRRQPLAGGAPPRCRARLPPRRSRRAPAGSVLHAIGDEGVPIRDDRRGDRSRPRRPGQLDRRRGRR